MVEQMKRAIYNHCVNHAIWLKHLMSMKAVNILKSIIVKAHAMVTFSSEISEIWEHVPKSLKIWEAFRNFRKILEEFSGWPSSEDDHGLAL